MRGTRTNEERARARLGTHVKDKWRLDALLGLGGTAAVYLATHRNGKRAAIKMIYPELLANDDLVARFAREGLVANRVEHPGVPAILDDDCAEDGALFLVMELLEGHSLHRHAQRPRLLPWTRVLELMDETLDVLDAAHRRGIIHRDIKPGNLFLTNAGHIKVLDFGVARLAEPRTDRTATQTGTMIGTPAYMPPEQARGRWHLIDARTDLWALGATMFALLTGQRPRKAETVQEELLAAMTSPVPSIASFNPALPPSLVALVDRALAYEMDARWPSAAAMREAIQGVLAELASTGVTAPAEGDPSPPGDGQESAPPPPTGSGTDVAAVLTTSRPIATSPAITAAGARTRGGGKAAWALAMAAFALGAALIVKGGLHATPAAATAPTVAPEPPPAESPLPPAITTAAATAAATAAPSAPEPARTETKTARPAVAPPPTIAKPRPAAAPPAAAPTNIADPKLFDRRF
jgi:serine/threonine-protein kinase